MTFAIVAARSFMKPCTHGQVSAHLCLDGCRFGLQMSLARVRVA
jgi:hypothetical protein